VLLLCAVGLLDVQNIGKFFVPDVLKGQFFVSISVVKALAEDAENLGSLASSEGEVDFLTVTYSLNYFEEVYLI